MAHQHRRRRTYSVLAVAGVLALAGFMFAANARIDRGTRDAGDLGALVQAELDRADQVADEVAMLQAEVDELADAQAAPTPGGPATPSPDPVALAAGWVAVTGPGLEVHLSDAPAGAARPEWATNDDLVVHQQDIQAVMNALWAGGAEAMSLQDQRVISTSAFRCVGNVLYLQGRVYSPPYVIRAIGDVDAMVDALADSPAVAVYLDYVDAVGLGWSVTEADLTLPAYDGPAELSHATATTTDDDRR